MAITPASGRLGASLRARRIDLGLTQEELSGQLGISRTKISAMENGRFASARLLFEVSEAIGLDLFLLPREERMTHSLRQQQEALQHTISGTRVKRNTDG